jgi:glycosyltransferase involved in cell wall biosynthesis
MKPFINIVIPTRERAEPLYWAIKSCLLQDYSNYKIVISDNDSMDNTAEIVHAFSDSRIEYIKTSRRLSMSENWEFALKHVDEGYVIYLGDDDGLVPNVLTIVAGLSLCVMILNGLIQKNFLMPYLKISNIIILIF